MCVFHAFIQSALNGVFWNETDPCLQYFSSLGFVFVFVFVFVLVLVFVLVAAANVTTID